MRSWKAFCQWVAIIRRASLEHALYAARKVVAITQGEESLALFLSLSKREGANGQSLSEGVRRLSERALQKGLECRRQALHKWLSHALKGEAGPAHRWCAKEDALTDLPLVIRDSQGVFTADHQCVAEHYA